MDMTKLEIYDCTLREGEQAAGVRFSINERLEIAQALSDIGVDYIELGWPVHPEVLEAFHQIKKIKLNSKIVAFGSTSIAANAEEDKNLESLIKSQAEYACIFGKSWLEHVEKQLRISAEENLKKISDSITFLRQNGMKVFYDAEHYFDAFKSNREYALETLKKASEAGAERIILCETNGGAMPDEVKEIVKETKKYLEENKIIAGLGVHFHNDCGLALANTLESLDYIKQIQVTVNGIGERVGNADLCEVVPVLILKKGKKLNVQLEGLKDLSELVYDAANLPGQITQAFVSSHAFSHKGGVHIDATRKGASYEHIDPEELGLSHKLMLSSLGGAACVISAAEKFGYKLDKKDESTKKKISLVLEELSELEKKGYDCGDIEAEQFILIEKHFGDFKTFFKVNEWNVKTNDEDKSRFYMSTKINGNTHEIEKEIIGGPVDAAYKAMFELISKNYPEIGELKLSDYKVRIAKSHGVESSVRTRIEFSDGEQFSTVGVSDNIIKSNIEAIEKAFNYYLNRKYLNKD